MDDLEAGLQHEALGIEGRIGDGCFWFGEKAAFGVAKDIELKLAHAHVELFGDRWMGVVERFGELGVRLF